MLEKCLGKFLQKKKHIYRKFHPKSFVTRKSISKRILETRDLQTATQKSQKHWLPTFHFEYYMFQKFVAIVVKYYEEFPKNSNEKHSKTSFDLEKNDSRNQLLLKNISKRGLQIKTFLNIKKIKILTWKQIFLNCNNGSKTFLKLETMHKNDCLY